jgi:hypothetical protein
MDGLLLLGGFGVAGWLVFAVLGYYVARQKRRSRGEGFFLGLLFVPFGVLIVALLPQGEAPARSPAKRRATSPGSRIPEPRADLRLLGLEPEVLDDEDEDDAGDPILNRIRRGPTG